MLNTLQVTESLHFQFLFILQRLAFMTRHQFFPACPPFVNMVYSVFTDENPVLPILGYSDIPNMPNVTIDIDGVTKLLQRIIHPRQQNQT